MENNPSLLVGRQTELRLLHELTQSPKSEFLAVYGRRRVGKTFLIREAFGYRFDFQLTGLANASTRQQLFGFHTALERQSPLYFADPPENWLVAFQRLISHLEHADTTTRKVIFIDEMPWLDTRGSDFLMALEHFWNSWASNRRDILLIACGSAASWMRNTLINHPGGLHNRLTHQMRIVPFSLHEVEAFLNQKNCLLDRYQLVQLYMALGGIPYYLDAVRPGWSAAQAIQNLLFNPTGLLQNEFFNLYRSLFRKHEVYEKVVAALATRTVGLHRQDIIRQTGLASGGTLTKVLTDLEESGFIHSYTAFDETGKNTIYRLSDYYTAFFFRFINGQKNRTENYWLNQTDSPAVRAWQGFAFEQVCLDHIRCIKRALGIEGVATRETAWRGKTTEKAAQIDLLIDRRDGVINLCECKFSLNSFVIDKAYAGQLRDKMGVFKQVTQTRKSVFLTMLTTFGVERNAYATGLVQNEVILDDLFTT